MADIQSIFQKEYQTGSETNPYYQDELLPLEAELPIQTDFLGSSTDEAKKYGIGKPIRIIIRAEIIHD